MPSKFDSPSDVPAALADDSWVTGPQIAAAAAISYGHFNELRRLQQVPDPEIQQPRFVRWKASTARRWLAELASLSVIGDGGAQRMKAGAASQA